MPTPSTEMSVGSHQMRAMKMAAETAVMTTRIAANSLPTMLTLR